METQTIVVALTTVSFLFVGLFQYVVSYMKNSNAELQKERDKNLVLRERILELEDAVRDYRRKCYVLRKRIDKYSKNHYSKANLEENKNANITQSDSDISNLPTQVGTNVQGKPRTQG
jgi:hypothetical protein